MLPGYMLPERTQKICTMLKWLTVLVGISYIFYIFKFDLIGQLIHGAWNQLPKRISDLVIYSDGKKTLLNGLALLFLIADYIVLWAIFQLFAAFETSDTFSNRSVKSIRALGTAILVTSIFWVIRDSVMVLALTLDNPPGSRLLVLSASTGQARMLLISLVFLLISHVFTQAVRISDENRQIV